MSENHSEVDSEMLEAIEGVKREMRGMLEKTSPAVAVLLKIADLALGLQNKIYEDSELREALSKHPDVVLFRSLSK